MFILILNIYIFYFIISIKLLNFREKMRAIIEYFDISMAIVNSFILVFSAIIFQSNAILMIINLISIGVLCGLSIYTFSQNNPYSFVSGFVLAVFGFIFSIGLLHVPELAYSSMVSILLVLILILNICFGASLVKGSANSLAFIGYKTLRPIGTNIKTETLIPTVMKDINSFKVKKNTRKLMQEKFKLRLIFLITVISSISFLSTVILSVI